MYSHKSELAKTVCDKVGFSFGVGPLEAMERKGIIFVRGTALKPQEASRLQSKCEKHGFVFKGPFADRM